MPEQLERAQRYRKRAEELRATEHDMMLRRNTDNVARTTLIVLARQYESFAMQLERASNAGGLSSV